MRRFALGCIAAVVLAAAPTALFVGVECYRPAAVAAPAASAPNGIEPYLRAEAFTYLTLPEWFIVYNTEEYAQFIAGASPTTFPYLRSIGQYWRYYAAVCRATRGAYPFEGVYHVMLGVIGASFTAEYALKAVYENTIGRVSGWFGTDTAEDAYAASVASEYGRFMHTVPWYAFPFARALLRLWTDVPLLGGHLVRKWERRAALSAEYAIKAVYGAVIGFAVRSSGEREDLVIGARVLGATDAALEAAGAAVAGRGAHGTVILLPRYEPFTGAALRLVDDGAGFLDVAGNDDILVSAIAPIGMGAPSSSHMRAVVAEPLATDPARQRLALSVPVRDLGDVLRELRNAGATIEHIYDY